MPPRGIRKLLDVDHMWAFLSSRWASRSPVQVLRHHRFTPTRVGTTQIQNYFQTQLEVHPHARGDNVSAAVTHTVGSGSPPRAWGQRYHDDLNQEAYRFTPTRVGTTANERPSAAALAVLTPRAWGQLSHPVSIGAGARFTPSTRVGTTSASAIAATSTPVHPHARGDNAFLTQLINNSGSPPRACGQRHQLAPYRHQYRFTPTCVGDQRPEGEAGIRRFTPTRVGDEQRRATPPTCGMPVHPHARGDNRFPRAPP